MTWTPIGEDNLKFAQQLVFWIKTVKASGGAYYNNDWLPSMPDIVKSALFERIRSGKKPLPYPPPLACSCPWYAVVEDKGPHVIDKELNIEPNSNIIKCYFSRWEIVYKYDYTDYEDTWLIAKDPSRNTPYRWKIWLEKCYVIPNQSEGPALLISIIQEKQLERYRKSLNFEQNLLENK